jgi:hypothetical protein
MASFALAGRAAGRDVQRCEERGGAVPDILMRDARDVADTNGSTSGLMRPSARISLFGQQTLISVSQDLHRNGPRIAAM